VQVGASANTAGRVDIYDGQIDTMTVGAGDEVEFDVALRVSGPQEDFATDHSLQITLRDSEVVEIKKLELPIYSIVPASHRLPGYELSLHTGARVAFLPPGEGAYDLSFALDERPAEPRLNAPITVRLLDSN
jgi:hypothetical protein